MYNKEMKTNVPFLRDFTSRPTFENEEFKYLKVDPVSGAVLEAKLNVKYKLQMDDLIHIIQTGSIHNLHVDLKRSGDGIRIQYKYLTKNPKKYEIQSTKING